MNRKYIIKLTTSDRQHLENLITSGTSSARKQTRARILLKSDRNGANWTYAQIIEAFNTSNITISTVRRRYLEGGVEAAIERKKTRREYKHRLDGEAEAHLIAMACGEAPRGYNRWTLRLLKKEMVKRMVVETVSHETIRSTLKKTNLSLG